MSDYEYGDEENGGGEVETFGDEENGANEEPTLGDEEDSGEEDVYVETTSESWCDRVGNAIWGICIGLLLFFGSFPLLFWNEGRAVRRYDALDEGAALTKSISGNFVDPANEGRLVYFTAMMQSSGNLTDPIFGTFTAEGDLKLRRNVEVYQWTESVESKQKKKIGGGTETVKTYCYSKSWESRVVDSGSFKDPSGHENPGQMRFEPTYLTADNITIGAFLASQELINRANWYAPITEGLARKNIRDVTTREDAEEYGKGFYFGNNTSSPAIGDTRVDFDSVSSSTITVVGQQKGNTLASYQTEAGGEILLFKQGTYSMEQIYEQAEQENSALTWILRFVGYLVMGFGIYLVLRPIEVLADVLPFVGDIVGAGITFVAFVIAALLSGLTISIAWLIYHPVIGIIVLAVITSTTALVVFLVKKLKKELKKKGEE